ncbi:MAG TPA: type II toxin-antitoxin system prevent-host-death family antitoxin [Anaeromyxobacteraceae bacterium]|nr:type II toxin-antitoxin system prevent-host-death family antitoxin [Anaeromyxobacteraceae bacterium]
MARHARVVVNIATAKARLPELVRRAAAGEEIVIARDHRPVARLAPLARLPTRKAGSARGQVVLAEDFDATPEGFEGYLE